MLIIILFLKNPKNKIRLATGRAGNVIGGGDWAKDRIVVDCMKNWADGKIVELRSPEATRPWQHVLEPLSGYLTLGSQLNTDNRLLGESFNFGPRSEQNRTVLELLTDLSQQWNFTKAEDAYSVTDNIPFHEAGLLKLNCDKALFNLRWEANLSYKECVKMVGEWYYSFYKVEKDMYKLTLDQITQYENLAMKRDLIWNQKIIDIEGVSITPIKKICHEKGDIYHALKSTEDSFTEFGEAYFTTVHKGDIKGWKKHTKMVMNLIVPVGEVGFYFYDQTNSKDEFIQVGLSNYVRVTVQPGIWVAFEGLKEELNLILNIASITHDPIEAINVELNTFPLLKKR